MVADKVKGKLMTTAQKTYKKQLIQKIQINKKNVFVDDEERKEFILSRFGVKSTTNMNIDQLKLLLDFCYRKVSDIPLYEKVENKDNITPLQKEKIMVLWNDKANDKSEAALLSFASRVTNYKTTSLDNLLKGKATKLIIALDKLK